MSDSVVIVGGGIAGQAVCEALRERDPDVSITLVCGEVSAPYDRVRLSEILVSGEDPETLQLRPGEWYDDHDVTLMLGRWATSVDSEAGRLQLDDGLQLAFDKLVLATGSQPLMPPISGIDLPGVHPFRGPEDCEAIRAAALGGARHAAVIGGGLLGLEAARGIAAQGCAVTVIHLLDRLMERQLDAGAAALLAPALADLDVAIQFDRNTTAIIGPQHATGLHFKGGERLLADLVVVSVGIRPEASLARSMGVECERGIVVDDAMRTSLPGVWAVGECAQHRGLVYGLVAPIHDQARVAAATLTANDAAYLGSVPSAKLKVAGIDLVCAGEATGDHEAVVTDGAAGIYRKLATRNGRVVGAILLGDTRGSEALVAAVRAGEPVDDPLQALADASLAGPADLPDTAQICDCNGVCKGDLVAAVSEGGCATPREVMAVTRSGHRLRLLPAGGHRDRRGRDGRAVGRADLPVPVSQADARAARGTHPRRRAAVGLGGRRRPAAPGASAASASRRSPTSSREVNANRHQEERDARFINDRVHANIQKDGTFSVVPRMYGGVCTPDELRRIADVADKYEVPLVKVTGGQRLDLLGVRKQDLPEIWADLGMPSGHAYAKAVRTVKTCVGTDFCRFGLGDAIGLGHRDGEAVGGPAHAAQGEVRRLRLPAQLCRGDGQGHRLRRRRGRLAGASRRRGGRQRARGRHPRDRRDARRGAARGDHVPAVLPRERRLQGAHVRLHPARRPREGARDRTRREDGRGAARAPADREGRDEGSVARARRSVSPQAVLRPRDAAGRRRRARPRRTARRR